MSSEQYKQGMQILGMIGDPEGKIVAESLRSLDELAPGLSKSVVEFVYGDIYSREGLDLKSREIAAIAALAVTGSKPQLTDHIVTGLVAGLTKEEIREILLQTVVYAGFPVAINALTTACEVFAMWDEKMKDAD